MLRKSVIASDPRPPRLRRIAGILAAAVALQPAALTAAQIAPGTGGSAAPATQSPADAASVTILNLPERLSKPDREKLKTILESQFGLIVEVDPANERRFRLTGPKDQRAKAVLHAEGFGATREMGDTSPPTARNIPINNVKSRKVLEELLRSIPGLLDFRIANDASLIVVGTEKAVALVEQLVEQLKDVAPPAAPATPPAPKPTIMIYPLEYISPEEAQAAIVKAGLTVTAAKGAQVVVPVTPGGTSLFENDPSELRLVGGRETDFSTIGNGSSSSSAARAGAASPAQVASEIAGATAGQRTRGPEAGTEAIGANTGRDDASPRAVSDLSFTKGVEEYGREQAALRSRNAGAGPASPIENILLDRLGSPVDTSKVTKTLTLREGLGPAERDALIRDLRKIIVKTPKARKITVDGRKLYFDGKWVKPFTAYLKAQDRRDFALRIENVLLNIAVDENGATRRIEAFHIDPDTPGQIFAGDSATPLDIWPVFETAREGRIVEAKKVRVNEDRTVRAEGYRVALGRIAQDATTGKRRFVEVRPVITNGSRVLVRQETTASTRTQATAADTGDDPPFFLTVGGDKRRQVTVVDGQIRIDEEPVRLERAADGQIIFSRRNRKGGYDALGFGEPALDSKSTRYSIDEVGEDRVVRVRERSPSEQDRIYLGEVDGYRVVAAGPVPRQTGASSALTIEGEPLYYSDPEGQLEVSPTGGKIAVTGFPAAVDQARRIAQERDAFAQVRFLLRVGKLEKGDVDAVVTALQDETGPFRLGVEKVPAALPVPRLLLLAGWDENIDSAKVFAADRGIAYQPKGKLPDELAIVQLGTDRQQRDDLIAQIQADPLRLVVVRVRDRLYLAGPSDRLGDVAALPAYAGATQDAQEAPPFTANVPNILLTGTPEEILGGVRLLNRIDIAPPQVAIEARLLEITPEEIDRLGISWTDFGSTTINGILDTTIVAETGARSPLKFGAFTRDPLEFNATLSALVRDRRARVLASPNLTVVDRQEAVIFIGDIVRFPAFTNVDEFGRPILQTGELGAGITLLVKPQIHLNDRAVTLRLVPAVSSLLPPLTANSQIPQLRLRRAVTTVRLLDGEIMAIGGLINQEEVTAMSKIPLLGDLPLVGELFRNRSKDRRRTELAIFIQPRLLVGPMPESAEQRSERPRQGEITLPEDRVFPLLDDLLVLAPPAGAVGNTFRVQAQVRLRGRVPVDARNGTPVQVEIGVDSVNRDEETPLPVTRRDVPGTPQIEIEASGAARGSVPLRRQRVTIVVPPGSDRALVEIQISNVDPSRLTAPDAAYRVVASRGGVRISKPIRPSRPPVLSTPNSTQEQPQSETNP